MFRRFFYTRLLMVNMCDKIAAVWTNKHTRQIQMMGKNVGKKATYLKHKKKAIDYANRAEKWLNRGTKILNQMKKEES